jgi:hypothetical protein
MLYENSWVKFNRNGNKYIQKEKSIIVLLKEAYWFDVYIRFLGFDFLFIHLLQNEFRIVPMGEIPKDCYLLLAFKMSSMLL